MVKISVQVEERLADVITALSRAAGMSKSAWIRRTIMDRMDARPEEIRDVPIAARGTTKMVCLRLPVEDIEAMEHVARLAGLTRGEWIKRTLRWQLWDRAGELRLLPQSQQEIVQLTAQMRAIGRSLNQAVKAMNAANRPDSPVEITSAARAVLAMDEELSGIINATARELTAIASGEVRYWTGKDQWDG